MSVIDDVIAHLTTNSIIEGGTGWEGVIDHMPDSPDKVVAVFPTGGDQPELSATVRYPTFQIRVRGEANVAGYNVMRDKMEAIYSELLGIANEVVNTVTYAFIIPISEVLSLGRDKNNRPEISRNFRTAITN